MSNFIAPIAKLIEEFAKLPGVGRKSAQRLAFHIVDIREDEAMKLTSAILEAKRKIRYCEKCFNITDINPCRICKDTKRNQSVICVVENPKDVIVIEKTKEYTGLYHVLHGAISPMDGVGPNEIKIKELLRRIGENDISELIIATNPTIEGEATAMYISKLISPLGILVTRIAHGVPVGGDIEFADEITLSKAIEGRRKL